MLYKIYLKKEKKTLTMLVSVRAQVNPQPKRFGQWPNKPTTMNLLKSGFDIGHLMS